MVGAVGTVESVPLEGHLPMGMPLYHLKNIYVAIATLASALLIFALVVSQRPLSTVGTAPPSGTHDGYGICGLQFGLCVGGM